MLLFGCYIPVLNNNFENLKNIYSFFQNIKRLNTESLHYGSARVYIKALNEGVYDLNQTHYFIGEGDLLITNNQLFNYFINDFNNIKYSDKWDVIILTPIGYNSIIINKNNLTYNNFSKTKDNSNTSAFIIKNYMIPIIINKFNDALNDINYREEQSIFNFKTYWKDLQEEHNFYVYNNIFAGISSRINNTIIPQEIVSNNTSNDIDKIQNNFKKYLLVFVVLGVGLIILSILSYFMISIYMYCVNLLNSIKYKKNRTIKQIRNKNNLSTRHPRVMPYSGND